MTALADTPAASSSADRPRRARPSWLGLVVQPAAVAVVFAAFCVWLSAADLTSAERTTLNPSALVTGRRDAFVGVITVEVVMEAITRARKAAATALEGAPVGTNTGPLPVVGQPQDAPLADDRAPAEAADAAGDGIAGGAGPTEDRP